MKYKKTFKEIFQSATFYTAMSMPVLGAAGGAWAAVTSTLATGAGAAVALGLGGAVVGVGAGAVIGAVGFVTANAIYENKEHIVIGTLIAATLPFMLAGKALGNLAKKAQGWLRKGPSKAVAEPPQIPPAASAEQASTLPPAGQVGQSFGRALKGGEAESKPEASPQTAPAPATPKKPGA